MHNLNFRIANQIEDDDATEWLTPFIPLAGATFAYGEGGVGKTSFFNLVAAQVTAGKAGGVYDGQGKGVLILNKETRMGTMRAKLEASGADTRRVTLLGPEEEVNVCRGLESQLGRYVDEHDISLVIFDPITAYIGNASNNKHEDIKNAVIKLNLFAMKHNAAVVMISHFNRSQHSIADAYIGSVAWVNQSRQAIGFVRDKERDLHLIQVTKSNEGETGGVYAYDMQVAENTVPGQQAIAIAGNLRAAPEENPDDVLARQYSLNKAMDPETLGDNAHEVYSALIEENGIALRSRIIDKLGGGNSPANVRRLTRARQQLEKLGLARSARLKEPAARTIWYLAERYHSADEAREAIQKTLTANNG
ncbi:AAA family ATPase [Bifidobacterium catulorum]|nr:AAA family ATPase [Bifidobacterium catulorum]